MSEPIGLASGLADLATFAFQASVALYTTVKSYNSHQKHVGDFAEKTSVLSEVLGLLTETLSAPRKQQDLTALEVRLRQCGKTCKEFEQEIQKFSQRSGGSGSSFRDWAKLTYMGHDIDGFRRDLHKVTVIIR